MNTYTIAYEADLRCYPNYSFEVADIDGDGRMEYVCLDHTANLVRLVRLDGELLFEKQLTNNGTWGTALPAAIDLDGDGRRELVVPNFSTRGGSQLLALNAEGEPVATAQLRTTERDDMGIAVPLLRALTPGGAGPSMIAALAGGHVVALDSQLNECWRIEGFRHDFGHEFHLSDTDAHGNQLIAFCTMDHINGRGDSNRGELVVLDSDGHTLLREDVTKYYPDTHFDHIELADFRATGRIECLVEKGILIDLDGHVLWDATAHLEHGQWIAHTAGSTSPDRLIVISELWSSEGRGCLISGQGQLIADLRQLPQTELGPATFPGWRVLPTRCHIVRWSADSEPQIFVGEQACSPTSHRGLKTRRFQLQAFFLDLRGNLLGTLEFEDGQIEGYWYNGEVHSRVADVDGDGRPEIVFPRQDGCVMVIKRS